MLGKYCYQRLRESTKFKINMYDHSTFDITNQDDVYAMVCNNDCIINCVAYTDVDKAESNSLLCKNVNGISLDYLAYEINKQKKFLIHISSDFVYGDIKDDSLTPLYEDDIVHPINIYGESKLEGDNNILMWMSSRYLILRVSWLFGPYGNNFIDKIYNQLLDKNIDKIKVVNDQYGRLTSTKLVVDVIMNWIVFGFKSGFYNLSCNGDITTKYDIACEIKQLLNVDKKIIPVSSGFFKTVAMRQKNSILSCEKLDKQALLTRSYWQNDLANYIKYKKITKYGSCWTKIYSLFTKIF